MATCKICRKLVQYGEVVHSACRETYACRILGTVCDEYCRFPFEAADIDELEEKHCNECKIAKMLGVKQKKRGRSGGRRKQPQKELNVHLF